MDIQPFFCKVLSRNGPFRFVHDDSQPKDEKKIIVGTAVFDSFYIFVQFSPSRPTVRKVNGTVFIQTLVYKT